MAHGQIGFNIVLTLVTMGASGINALRTAVQGGMKTTQAFIRSALEKGVGTSIERAKPRKFAAATPVEFLDDFAGNQKPLKSADELKRRKAYEQYSPNWSRVDLNDILKKFGVDKTKGALSDDLVKTYYTNPETRMQVVVDNENSYLRIFDLNKRQFVMVNGKVPSTGHLLGQQAVEHYQQMTHYNFYHGLHRVHFHAGPRES